MTTKIIQQQQHRLFHVWPTREVLLQEQDLQMLVPPGSCIAKKIANPAAHLIELTSFHTLRPKPWIAHVFDRDLTH